MTRRYERNITELRKDSSGNDILDVVRAENWSFSVYPGDTKSFTVSNGRSTKTVNVQDCTNYTYKASGKRLYAKGGAYGLYKFIDDCLFNQFMECKAWEVLDFVMKSGK